MKTKLRLIFSICIILSIGACHPNQVKLKPADSRPVQSVEIADADEAALLQQQLGLEIKEVQGNRLYYYLKDKDQNKKLIDLGYSVKDENAMQVNYKIVELSVNGKAPDTSKVEELKKYGIEVINKEENYWVVRGSLENLNQLQKLGYTIKIPDKEPRPREVEIKVSAYTDVQKVNELGVDIYSSQVSKDSSIIIYGGAFDSQIEKMLGMGYQVTKKK